MVGVCRPVGAAASGLSSVHNMGSGSPKVGLCLPHQTANKVTSPPCPGDFWGKAVPPSLINSGFLMDEAQIELPKDGSAPCPSN